MIHIVQQQPECFGYRLEHSISVYIVKGNDSVFEHLPSLMQMLDKNTLETAAYQNLYFEALIYTKLEDDKYYRQ